MHSSVRRHAPAYWRLDADRPAGVLRARPWRTVLGLLLLLAMVVPQRAVLADAPPAPDAESRPLRAWHFAEGNSRNGFETLLVRLGVRQKNSRPNHPTTCGKVERFQQTLKRWLRTQPSVATLAELQAQLDAFVDLYNHHRPHRSLPHHATPAVAYTTRPKAAPNGRDEDGLAFSMSWLRHHDRYDDNYSVDPHRSYEPPARAASCCHAEPSNSEPDALHASHL